MVDDFCLRYGDLLAGSYDCADGVYQDSSHIMDPDWGHVTIKMPGHPPFAAPVILNGREHVAITAAAGIGFGLDGWDAHEGAFRLLEPRVIPA